MAEESARTEQQSDGLEYNDEWWECPKCGGFELLGPVEDDETTEE